MRWMKYLGVFVSGYDSPYARIAEPELALLASVPIRAGWGSCQSSFDNYQLAVLMVLR